MKAVILPTMDLNALKPLIDRVPEYLLPVANKPIVEHAIELLYSQGIKEIILVVRHKPYETEQYFGSGERWGVRIFYVLEKAFNSVSASLLKAKARLNGPFVCLPGNMITNINFQECMEVHEQSKGDMTLLSPRKGESIPSLNYTPYRLSESEILASQGLFPFILNADSLDRKSLFSSSSIPCMNNLISSCGMTVYQYQAPFTALKINSLKDYWNANKEVLKGKIKGISIPGKQIKDGIWVGLNCKIHPQSELNPTVLIGDHCQINKGVQTHGEVVIGNHCIVGENSSLENSVVNSDTFVGDSIELKDSVVDKNLMIKVLENNSVFLTDHFLLGNSQETILRYTKSNLFSRMLAFFLFVVFSPAYITGIIWHLMNPGKNFLFTKTCLKFTSDTNLQGNNSPMMINVNQFRSQNILFNKLPGLIHVMKGELSLVGHAPKEKEESETLFRDWKCFQGKPGLFNIIDTLESDEWSWEERLLVEEYYSITRSLGKDLKILVACLFNGFAKSSYYRQGVLS